MNERNTQGTPFNMKHAPSANRKRGGGKGRMLSRPQMSATKSSRGFGHFGAQSYGGRGK